MPQNQVASGTCDRTMNPADGVGSLKRGPRTNPAHAEGRLVYKSADWHGQDGNPGYCDGSRTENRPMATLWQGART